MSDHQYSSYFDVENEYCDNVDNGENVYFEEVQNDLPMNNINEAGIESSVDELLIDAVRSYPHIYDKSSKDFKDITKRNNSWREIADILNLPVEECQTRWTRLREKFSREKRMQEQEERSGSGTSQRQKFAFMRSMQFLHKFVKTRSAYTVPKLLNRSVGSGLTQIDIKAPVDLPVSSQLGNSSKSYSQSITCDVTDTDASNTPPLKERYTKICEQDNKCYSTPKTAKRKRPEVSLDPIEKTLLEMSSNIASQIGQQESAELAFGRYVGLELQKMTEPNKIRKKKMIMDILCE